MVTYPTVRTNGPGYTDLNRYYNLECCSNLFGAPWTLVPSATNQVGDNTTKSYADPAPLDANFYRVRVRVE